MAHDFRRSNTTSNYFMGTTQRSWMQPGNQAGTPQQNKPVWTAQNEAQHEQQETGRNNAPSNSASTNAGARQNDHGQLPKAQPMNVQDQLPTLNTTDDDLYILDSSLPSPPESVFEIPEPVQPPAPAMSPPMGTNLDEQIRSRLLQSQSARRSLPQVTSTTNMSSSAYPAPISSTTPITAQFNGMNMLSPVESPNMASKRPLQQTQIPPPKRPATTDGRPNAQSPQNATRSPVQTQYPPHTATPIGAPAGRIQAQTNGTFQQPNATTTPLQITSPVLRNSVSITLLSYLPQLDGMTKKFREMYSPGAVFDGRVLLLRDACINADMFFIVFHQLFCLWTFETNFMLSALYCTLSHAAAFKFLEQIIHDNSTLNTEMMFFFSRFTNSQSQLVHLQTTRQCVEAVKAFLDGFEGRWDWVRLWCTKGLPPSAYVISYCLRCRQSPVLQRLFFNSILRQLYPRAPVAFNAAMGDLFKNSQSVLAQRQPDTTDQLTLVIAEDPEVKMFGQHVRQLCQTYQQVIFIAPTQQQTQPQPQPQSQLPSTGVVNHGFRTQPQSRPPPQPSPPLPFPQGIGRPTQPGVSHQVQQPLIHPAPAPNRQPQNVPAQAVHRQRPVQSPSAPNPLAAYPNATLSRPSRFFPPPGQVLPMTVNPEPNVSALHQSRVRSPPPEPSSQPSAIDPRTFCFMESFVMPPKVLPSEFVGDSFKFAVSDDIINRRAKDVTPADDAFGQLSRKFTNDSVLAYLRFVFVPNNQAQQDVSDSSWISMANRWPECCFLSLNGQFLEIRRKSQYRRDLAVDVSKFLKTGENELQVSMYRTQAEAGLTFAVAIDLVVAMNYERASELPIFLEAQAALKSITSSLGAGTDDDDLVMVDPHVSIDMVDPFTQQIVEKPVKGKKCQHRECFGLKAFLQSRVSRANNNVVSAEQWLCPICGLDARPSSLIINGFLTQVVDTLKEQGKTGAKAIHVKEDGSWEARFDEAQTAEQVGTGAPTNAVTPVNNVAIGNNVAAESSSSNVEPANPPVAAARPLIIDLYDDDD